MVNSFFLRITLNLFDDRSLGLNVYSILKHTTLVLTLRALNKVEKKLLHALHSYDTQKDQPPPPDEP